MDLVLASFSLTTEISEHICGNVLLNFYTWKCQLQAGLYLVQHPESGCRSGCAVSWRRRSRTAPGRSGRPPWCCTAPTWRTSSCCWRPRCPSWSLGFPTSWSRSGWPAGTAAAGDRGRSSAHLLYMRSCINHSHKEDIRWKLQQFVKTTDSPTLSNFPEITENRNCIKQNCCVEKNRKKWRKNI